MPVRPLSHMLAQLTEACNHRRRQTSHPVPSLPSGRVPSKVRAAREHAHTDGSPHYSPEHPQPASAQPGSAGSPLLSLRHWDEESESPLQLHLPPSPPSAGTASTNHAAACSQHGAGPQHLSLSAPDQSIPPGLCKPALSAPFTYDQTDSPTTPCSPHPAASQQNSWPAASQAAASSSAPPTPLQPAPNPPRGMAQSPRSASPWYQQRLHSMQAAHLPPSTQQPRQLLHAVPVQHGMDPWQAALSGCSLAGATSPSCWPPTT